MDRYLAYLWAVSTSMEAYPITPQDRISIHLAMYILPVTVRFFLSWLFGTYVRRKQSSLWFCRFAIKQ